MGLFDKFGSRKKAAEERAAKEAEEQKQREVEELAAQQKQAHEGMSWPGVMRMNLLKINTPGVQAPKIEDPISPERKEEIGNLIYQPVLTPADVESFTLQELIFLLDTHEIFNRKAALENYEANHRVIYNDLLRRIHEAEKFYILYDRLTGYPLIDGGFALIYLEKEHAEIAAKVYETQFRKTAVVERPGEGAPVPEEGPKPVLLFDYLYYLGMENIIIDNGWYKAAIKRSEISAPPASWAPDPAKIPPAAPELAFAMIDFVGEAKWPVRYEKRDERIRRKMDRINTLIPTQTFVIPVYVEGSEQTPEGQKPKVKFPLLKLKAKTKDSEIEQNVIPIFTDLFEYAKNFNGKNQFRPVKFQYRNAVQFLRETDGFVINPRGESIVLPRARAMELIARSMNIKVVKNGAPASAPKAPAGQQEAPAAPTTDEEPKPEA